ncbi:11955_t:CDS:2 [Ambispora gerdemannii]|uniref:11955_t:CDS:1 n=1 Tax=Ambispora gerdemannii TaxID=144530 RepID=A0A9N8WJA4_9GLOM|nr:11955_t:CDS:2 [Ambispora gerdemannii]
MVQTSTSSEGDTWTAFEKLLLAQAVYKYGDDNWLAVSRIMKQHPMIERQAEFFSPKICSNKYRVLIEPYELEAEAEKKSLVVLVSRGITTEECKFKLEWPNLKE